MTALPARRPLRILFVFRAPVGGLFRNVFDVIQGLVARGHHVGMLCDSSTGGARGEDLLAKLRPQLAMGLHRLPMRRNPHPSDVAALALIHRLIRDLKPDVVQGEGAKGGLYARLEGLLHPNSGPIRCYTPHGGSLNYHPGSLGHRVFMMIEWLLEKGTDLFLFESQFIRQRFLELVCATERPERVVLNGLYPHEYDVISPAPDATDFLYVGEFRQAKGLDTLIESFALLAQRGQRPTITLFGSGPEEEMLKARTRERGVAEQFRWHGVTPAVRAFRAGRIMLLPSRFESLPYVVLEAVAGQLPILSTDVGGIKEIIPQSALLPPNDAAAFAQAMERMLARPYDEAKEEARHRSEAIRPYFTVERMVETIETAYYDALESRRGK